MRGLVAGPVPDGEPVGAIIGDACTVVLTDGRLIGVMPSSESSSAEESSLPAVDGATVFFGLNSGNAAQSCSGVFAGILLRSAL